jgi:hypothetical protein
LFRRKTVINDKNVQKTIPDPCKARDGEKSKERAKIDYRDMGEKTSFGNISRSYGTIFPNSREFNPDAWRVPREGFGVAYNQTCHREVV